MKKKLISLALAVAMTIGVALPALAYYNHPCGSHISHTSKLTHSEIGGSPGIYAHTASWQTLEGDVWITYKVYWKPSVQHSNYTYKYTLFRTCY